jgi:hypothetical protein
MPPVPFSEFLHPSHYGDLQRVRYFLLELREESDVKATAVRTRQGNG